MTAGRLAVLVVALALVGVACGDDVIVDAVVEEFEARAPEPADPDPGGDATTTAQSPSTTAGPTASTTSAASMSPTTAAPAPAIAALTSGRGDDGSLEIGIWFSSSPFDNGDLRLLVGTDSDGSYPGTGDPVPHIDGWAEVTDGGISLLDGGVTIAADTDGGLDEWLSWTRRGSAIWVYFVGNVPVRAGTVWVVLEIDGSIVAGGIAGAPLGEGCSYQSAGVVLGSVPADVPDFGLPCRYPLG